MKPKNNLSENLNDFGIPLTEGVEVAVEFLHDGKPSVAVFDIEGGQIDRSHSREFPPENVDPEVDLIGIYFKDTEQEIYPKEVLDLDKLEDEAVEKYWDHFDEHGE
jgi:hypothetical protein